MSKGTAIFNPDVQSDIDMKNTWKLVNYPSSTNIISVAQTIYVDAINGTAGGQRGTTAAFQTLAQAVAVVQAGDVIEIRSDLTYSGAITISVAGVTLDFRNHVVSPSVQTDSRKLTISADGCVVRNIEINAIWDGASTTASTGAAIRFNNKRCRLENAYIHDCIDTAVEFNGDFSDGSVKSVKVNNIRLRGVSANSQNNTITRADFLGLTLSNTGDKGLAVARGGAESNQVYGINISDVYYDTVGTVVTGAEAIYVHGLTDFNISNVVGAGNIYNLSCDSCHNGTIENVITRGGLGATQFAALELAWGRNITVSNCIFDGLSRSGSTSIASPYGGIQCSNLNVNTPTAINLVFSNVISINWYTALSVTDASGVNVSGGVFSGSYAGTLFRFCDNVLVTGADISAVGSDGFDTPIAVDSGSGGAAYRVTNNNYRFVSNSLNASAGCTAEIEIKSQDVNHTIDGVTIRGNIKRDGLSLTSGSVKQTIGAGGAITNITITGNEPIDSWGNTTAGYFFNIGDVTGDVGNLNSKWLRVGPSNSEGVGLGYSVTDGKAYLQSIKPGVAWKELEIDASNITLTTHSGTAKVGANTIETQNNKGAASGYAPLDGSSKVPAANLPTLSSGTIASTSAVLKGDGSGNAIASTPTGTGDNVLATSPTLITPTIGVATATSVNKWVLTAPSTAATLVAGADSLTYTLPAITCNIGFREIPQNSQSANYTTLVTDNGKNIYHPVGDNNARTFTIAANASVAYPIGTGMMFTNMAAAALTVAINSDTLTLLGAGTTGSRTVAQYGRLYVEKDTATSWLAVPIANVT